MGQVLSTHLRARAQELCVNARLKQKTLIQLGQPKIAACQVNRWGRRSIVRLMLREPIENETDDLLLLSDPELSSLDNGK